MKTYLVWTTQVISRQVEVEATTKEEAASKARDGVDVKIRFENSSTSVDDLMGIHAD